MPTDINWTMELLGTLVWLQILGTWWVYGLIQEWNQEDDE